MTKLLFLFNSSEDLTNAFEIYYKLRVYKNDALSFINARNQGVEEGFNYAQKRIKDLIVKVGEVEGLKNEPVFKNCINDLVLLYDLKK